jgi:hypothetical protein
VKKLTHLLSTHSISSLEALSITSSGDIVGEEEELVLLSLECPRLKTLSLDAGGSDVDALKFFERHSLLERIELGPYMGGNWFGGLRASMLPQLTILKVRTEFQADHYVY